MLVGLQLEHWNMSCWGKRLAVSVFGSCGAVNCLHTLHLINLCDRLEQSGNVAMTTNNSKVQDINQIVSLAKSKCIDNNKKVESTRLSTAVETAA